jgi:hypothetical protein
MLVKKYEALSKNSMRDLFGKPPLLKDENPEDYWRLWDAFAADLNPKTWPEFIAVNDLAHKYWEQLRLRRYSSALIDGGCIEALEYLLRPFLGASEDPQMKNASSDIARFFYVGIGHQAPCNRVRGGVW